MYRNIYNILWRRKLQLKTRFFARVLLKLNIQLKNESDIWKFYLAGKYILDILLALGAVLLIPERYEKLSVTLILLYSFVSKLIDGMGEYRNTFQFPFEELLPFSLAKPRRLYVTQLMVAWGYEVLTDDMLMISAVYLLVTVPKHFLGVLLVTDLLLLNTVGFLLGNLLAGKYIYAVTINRISLLRGIQYIWTVGLLGAISVGIVSAIRTVVYDNFIKKFQTMEQFLDESYLEKVSSDATAVLVEFWKKWEGILTKTDTILYGSLFILGIGSVMILLLFREIHLISGNGNQVALKKRDFYDFYCKKWERCAKKKKDSYRLYQARLFSRYRHIVAKNFFQELYLDYECVVYLAFFGALLSGSADSALQCQLLICVNLMGMATQCSELKSGCYPYFALSQEIDKLALLKMSLAEPDRLWKTKEKAFYEMMKTPTQILLLYDVVAAGLLRLPLPYVGIIIAVLTGSFFLMPQVQLHMMPMLTNTEYLGETQIGESFEEDEIADKMQEIPRIFLVVIPNFIGILMLFFSQIRKEQIVYFEMLYLVFVGMLLSIYFRKIKKRGVKHLFRKINET